MCKGEGAKEQVPTLSATKLFRYIGPQTLDAGEKKQRDGNMITNRPWAYINLEYCRAPPMLTEFDCKLTIG